MTGTAARPATRSSARSARAPALAATALAALLLTACASSGAPKHGPQFTARPSRALDAAPAVATASPERLNLGAERDGFFYVPAKALAGPAPLLLFLHGARESGRMIDGFVPFADRTGTIVLAPDSRGHTWGLVDGDEDADLAFVDQALAKIFAGYSIDPRRIVVAGFSDGATAALSWGLTNGDLFHGIAAFSAGFVHLAGPAHGRPRIFMTHGQRDPVFPIASTGRRIAGLLGKAGYAIEFHEFDGKHEIPADLASPGLDKLFAP